MHHSDSVVVGTALTRFYRLISDTEKNAFTSQFPLHTCTSVSNNLLLFNVFVTVGKLHTRICTCSYFINQLYFPLKLQVNLIFQGSLRKKSCNCCE